MQSPNGWVSYVRNLKYGIRGSHYDWLWACSLITLIEPSRLRNLILDRIGEVSAVPGLAAPDRRVDADWLVLDARISSLVGVSSHRSSDPHTD